MDAPYFGPPFHESRARVLHHQPSNFRPRPSACDADFRAKRFTPGVLKWLEERGWLFADMRDESDVFHQLDPKNAGKLLDAFPVLSKHFINIEWKWGWPNKRELFYEFVNRGARFESNQRMHVEFEYLGPDCIQAFVEPPLIRRTSPFVAEVIAKFGIWSDRFDHPTINRMRWAERLKLLRKRMPEDGDGAIVFRVRSFCV